MLNKLVTKYFIGFFVFSLITLLVPSIYISYTNYQQTLELLKNKHENILKAYRHDYVNNILIDDDLTLKEFILQVKNQTNIDQCLSYNDKTLCTDEQSIIHSEFKYQLDSGGVILGEIRFFEKVEFLTSSNIIFVFIIFVILTLILFLFYRKFLAKIEVQFLQPTNYILENLLSIEKDAILNAEVLPMDTRKSLLNLIEFNDRRIETELNEQVLKKYSQIYHDIKSPLTGLEFSINELSTKISSRERLEAMTSLNRINDIVNSLTRQDNDTNKTQNMMLFTLIKNLIAQKEIEYSKHEDVEFKIVETPHSYGLFSVVNFVELERILSNIINNSIEAKDDQGLVIEVELSGDKEKNIISIRDNGQGIDESIISSVFTHGETTKDNGQGIGLAHAKDYMKSLDGDISLENRDVRGVEVKLAFNASIPPAWFCRNILIGEDCDVVIIDDDKSIHNLWSRKLSDSQKVYHCHNTSDFHQLMEKELEKAIYLFDYELLGDSETGLDLIEKYSLQKYSYLVTSHFREADIINKAKELDLKIIPKESVSDIPLKYYHFKQVVLIDDDERIHRIWKRSCEKIGVQFFSFLSFTQFKEKISDFPKDTLICVDSLLGDEKGELLAKEIYDEGFFNLFLTTGRPKGEIYLPNYFLDQIDKSFPLHFFK